MKNVVRSASSNVRFDRDQTYSNYKGSLYESSTLEKPSRGSSKNLQICVPAFASRSLLYSPTPLLRLQQPRQTVRRVLALDLGILKERL